MRKRTLGVVLLAGLAMSGAGAFTATNTMSQTSNVAGYGSATATGATVTDIAYNLGTDSSKLASVVFTTSTDVTGKTATLTLRKAGAQVGASYTCTLGTWTLDLTTATDTTDGSMTITCNTTEAIANFDETGLTVRDA